MQTFLPLPDFSESARVLDRLRLGSQRNEAKVILRVLMGELPHSPWRRHIVVRMWEGHLHALCWYGEVICTEWVNRGYKDEQLHWFLHKNAELKRLGYRYYKIPWLGDETFHASHRAALLHKNFKHYSQFGWKEKPRLRYVWPVREPCAEPKSKLGYG